MSFLRSSIPRMNWCAQGSFPFSHRPFAPGACKVKVRTRRVACVRWPAVLICVLLVNLLSGCHKKRLVVQLPSQPLTESATLPEDERTGTASWYGDPYHGRRTSNGEIYNKHTLTAAHRTLPFDTAVKVNNLENGKNVRVRINDRGPFVNNRIIDLSYAAAKEIDMIGPGSAKVRLDILEVQANPYPLTIQVGSFRHEENAEEMKKKLQRRFDPVRIKRYESTEGVLYRVFAGQFSTQELAASSLQDLKKENFEGLIVRMDP